MLHPRRELQRGRVRKIRLLEQEPANAPGFRRRDKFAPFAAGGKITCAALYAHGAGEGPHRVMG